MIFAQAHYRARQFWLALRPPALREAQLAPARAALTPAQMALFCRLQPSEQVHALRVLADLLAQGATDPHLQTAALLHDIGKICAPLHLWERVLIVVGQFLLRERAQKWGMKLPQGWARPFVVAAQHPAWGGELALGVGASPLTVALIRRHQEKITSPPTTEEDRLLTRLQAADQRN